MNILLTPEQEEIVRRRVRSGRSESEREAVDQALRLLDTFDRLDPELLLDRDVVRAEIQKGIDELDRGEGIRVTDRHAFVDDIIRRSTERRAGQTKPSTT